MVVLSAHTAFYKVHTIGDQSLKIQSSKTSAPVVNELSQKTIQNYIENLSTDDKKDFQLARDVMKTPAGSRIPIDITRIQQMQQCVKEFLGFIANFTSHDPQVSSLGMGGLNCIMTVSAYPIKFPTTYIITNALLTAYLGEY